MRHPVSAMTSPQILLSRYLQYDLYHSVGAYSLARDRLEELEKLIAYPNDPPPRDADRYTLEQDKLLQVTRLALQFNEKLVRHRHAVSGASSVGTQVGLGHPIPDLFPLTLEDRFQVGECDQATRDAREDARRNPWARPIAWGWVLNFYDTAIAAIDVVDRPELMEKLMEKNPRAAELAPTFALSMIWPRDRLTDDFTSDDDREKRRRELRKARFEERAKRALSQLPGIQRKHPHRSDDATEFLHRISTDNLSSGEGSVPLFVVSALTEAHLTQHAVEAWQSMTLEDHAEHAAPHLVPMPSPETAGDPHIWGSAHWLQKELNRCIVLDTFAYCASRCAPWIFAADDAECRFVFENFPDAWRNAVPTRCMWISAQVSLLALHRRAYSYALCGDRISAYNDYYKLQRQIRNARRRVDSAPLHISGAHEFLTFLEARANQNIGELYRSEHAQRPARKHFETALGCLKTIKKDGEVGEVLTNSRWHVELQISLGKASYEMGEHKESLRWHLSAWRAFLRLLAADTQTETSTEAVDEAIEWLEQVKFEPEIRKGEAQRRLRPVIDQLRRIEVDQQYGGLAAEILLRLGHVMLMLRLGLTTAPPAGDGSDEASERQARIDETLAFACLREAARCDPRSTLIAADLLKARLRLAHWLRGAEDVPQPQRERGLELPPTEPVADQWPRGGDDYERVVRTAEYLMLRSLDPDTGPPVGRESQDRQDEVALARGLLLNFFMHTDSINVRKGQAHRFLMKEPAPGRPPRDLTSPSIQASHTPPQPQGLTRDISHQNSDVIGPAIELVCMRRYSSAFPLLPRPSAFRAHGGGYFVRLHERQHRSEDVERADGAASSTPAANHRDAASGHRSANRPQPFGIVIDPGPDFIETLYRTGHSLSDVDMIIVTHDHVDHLNSLESLLSLLNYQSSLRTHQGRSRAGERLETERTSGAPAAPTAPERVLRVYGNKSIRKRYRDVTVLNPRRQSEFERRFRSLKRIGEDRDLPDGFAITPMSSKDVDGTGHLDLSDKPSYGVCFHHDGAKLSLAITSDTPAPPAVSDGRQHDIWTTTWSRALQADVLVAHMRTVPLTELRQITQLDARLSVSDKDSDLIRQQISGAESRSCEVLNLLGESREQVRLALASLRAEAERRNIPQASMPGYVAAVAELSMLLQLASLLNALEAGLKNLSHAVQAMSSPYTGSAGQARETLRDLLARVHDRGEQLAHFGDHLRQRLGEIEHRQILRDEVSRLARDLDTLSQNAQNPACDVETLERIRMQLEEADGDLRGRIEFAMWLRSQAPGPTADLVGLVPDHPENPVEHWRPPQDHPYLKGTLAWAREYRERRKDYASSIGKPLAEGLFVLGELSEELGTARGKVASQINETLFQSYGTTSFWALTSDVGLRVFVVPDAKSEHGCAKILCTTCDLDTDRVPDERYHSVDAIREVCVKGENEGIFYNCRHHDPGRQEERLFLERLERFDVFGR
jgi:hypothetical protein